MNMAPLESSWSSGHSWKSGFLCLETNKNQHIKHKYSFVEKWEKKIRPEFQRFMSEIFLSMESWSSVIFVGGFLPQTKIRDDCS